VKELKLTNKLPVPKEADIQRACKEWLQYHGWFVFKVHQSLGSYKGISDLIAIKNGRTIFVEIKTPKGRLSKQQEAFCEAIERHGGQYIVARGVEDLEAQLMPRCQVVAEGRKAQNE
jgi:Holliday junction resolvase